MNCFSSLTLTAWNHLLLAACQLLRPPSFEESRIRGGIIRQPLYSRYVFSLPGTLRLCGVNDRDNS